MLCLLILNILFLYIITIIMLQVKYGLVAVWRLAGETNGVVDWYENLFQRLDALLHEPSITMSHITEESSRFFSQLVAHNLRSRPSPVAGGVDLASFDWQGEVSRSLQRTVIDGNPILALYVKRICRVLLAGLLGGKYAHKLSGYSLAGAGQV